MKRKKLLIPLFAILAAAVINLIFIINARIPSGSMAPTINEDSFVIGNRLAYLTSEPKLGDVVFFKNKEVSSFLLIKRIIATPGDRFKMVKGRVYIDGMLLEEDYIDDFGCDDFDEITVPDGCYLMLGDNRCESNDSRYWENPFISKEQIKAKATLVWLPEFKKI